MSPEVCLMFVDVRQSCNYCSMLHVDAVGVVPECGVTELTVPSVLRPVVRACKGHIV